MAYGRGIPVKVNGKPRGKLVAISNDHPPTGDVLKGGSTMRLCFEDGSSIPAEQVDNLERRV